MTIRRQRKSRRKSKRRLSEAKPKAAPTGFVKDAKRDPRTGQVGVGNSLARKADGINRFKKTGELPEQIRKDVEEFIGEVVSDQGGASELSAIRRGYIRRLGDIDALARLAAEDIRKRGVFGDRGRTRSVVPLFLQFLDRWDKYAQRLGLERRTKPVTDIALALRDLEQRQ